MIPRVSFAQNQSLEFKKALHERVNAYFAQTGLSKGHNPSMITKTVIMLSLFFIPMILILAVTMPLWMVWCMYFVMGIGTAGIGMSVMHDANHAAYSTNQMVNRWVGLTMNMIGADSYNWKIKHNKLHHVFTNIYGKDEDINSRAILRFAFAAPLKGYHRFQHIYAWFFYLLMSLSMVFLDIPKRFYYRKKGITNISLSVFRKSLAWLILSKSIYFFVILVLPVLVTPLLWWQVLIGFFILHFTTGMILSVVFQMAHVVEGPAQTLPDAKGRINDTLLVHQLRSSCDFSRNNKLLSWYVGGLNFQTEHHLFPRICHIHYPVISKIVETTTREYNMPYFVFDSFGAAIRSHYQTLKKLGRVKDETSLPDNLVGTSLVQ
jgi:linoleoyl-CoA desaturase